MVYCFSPKDDAKACREYVRRKLGLPQWQPETNAERALKIWNEAVDPRGTIAEKYLNSRRLDLAQELSNSVLRFHPRCPWEKGSVPCLIAAFRSITSDEITAVHRIRVDRAEAPITERKMMLGPVKGSAIKLHRPSGERLVIGEGIESCLAGRQLGFSPVWSLGSAGGIKHFPLINGINRITVLGENDNGSNRSAADKCSKLSASRRVLVAQPPAQFKDFNDVVMGTEKNVAA